MLLRVWPRASRSGANEMSDIVNIDDSINGAREVDDNDNNNDNNINDTINNGRGTAIPER